MPVSIQFHTDPGLTVPVSSTAPNHDVSGSNDPQDFLFYFGSIVSANKFENVNDPGVDQLVVTVINATPLWLQSTGVAVNDTARSSAKNGYRFRVQSISGSGITGVSEPTWPLVIGQTVVDNEVTWVNDGKIHESTEIKLALTLLGLDSAVAGNPLNIGLVINGGSAGAVEVHMRIDDTTEMIGFEQELQLLVSSITETPI